jgi:hypothetical protein
MSAPARDTEACGELEDADTLAPAPVVVVTPAPLPATTLPLPSGAVPVGQTMRFSALQRVQLAGSRAIAEAAYQLRRLGTATLLGTAAGVIAGIVVITNNLPQGAVVTSLKSDLVRLSPLGNEGAKPAPTSSPLASLPSRTEAPIVVSKILEEARAAGVELPQGQYEFVPARDGVAARYRMTFPVRATYPQIRQFMDRTLLALPAVAIEGLRIDRKNVGDDRVDAELKLSAYVRSDP